MVNSNSIFLSSGVGPANSSGNGLKRMDMRVSPSTAAMRNIDRSGGEGKFAWLSNRESDIYSTLTPLKSQL